MSLFPALDPTRESYLLSIARIRRANRPNLAAWASARLKLSREHNAHIPVPEVRDPILERGGTFTPKTTGGSESVV